VQSVDDERQVTLDLVNVLTSISTELTSLVAQVKGLQKKLEEMEKDIEELKWEALTRESPSDTVHSVYSAHTGISWLGVFMAVILGGLVLRACH